MMKTAIRMLVMGLLISGCNGTATSPSTAATPYNTMDLFAGSLDVQGTASYSFTVQQTATVTVTLASLITNSTGAPLPTALVLGLGTSNGLGCSTTSMTTTSPALVGQVTTSLAAGNYCVTLADGGSLPESASFAVRITQESTPRTSGTSTITETFASNATSLDSAARAFPVENKGNIAVTLTSLSPSAPVGLALGIEGVTTPTCSIFTQVTTVPGSSPQITSAIDEGVYCVKIFNLSPLQGPLSFSISVTHP